MKKYVISIIAAVVAIGSLRAQNSDATVNRIHETYTLNEDGSVDYNLHKEIRFNTQYSFNRLFGETFVVYNPEFQTLKINDCHTVQKDGTRIELPANALNEVLPAAAADAPAYNHLREMVITHTGLETGATVYLDYTLRTEAGFYPSLDIDRIFSIQGADVKEYKVTVNVPAVTDLRWSLTDSRVRLQKSGDQLYVDAAQSAGRLRRVLYPAQCQRSAAPFGIYCPLAWRVSDAARCRDDGYLPSAGESSGRRRNR